jgi:hypothetical protein
LAYATTREAISTAGHLSARRADARAGQAVLVGHRLRLDTRSQIQTEQGKAALRSLFELKDASGSAAELFFGPTPPEGEGGRWIQTLPGKGWFVYFRIYGPETAAFNGDWKPADFHRM